MTLDRWSVDSEFVLHYDVTSLLARNARGVDRGDWELMRSTYHHDAIDHHGPFQGTADDLIEYLRERQRLVNTVAHVLGQTSLLEIDRPARTVRSETSCVGVQELKAGAVEVPEMYRTEPDGAAGVSVMGVRYVDVLSEREGELRIQHRTVVHEYAFTVESHSATFVTGKISGTRDAGDFSHIAAGGSTEVDDDG